MASQRPIKESAWGLAMCGLGWVVSFTASMYRSSGAVWEWGVDGCCRGL